MWWEVVFPSLLPFFILSELLIGFGIVKFVGLLLEPFMRPIFRVPGVGGFVLAMGMASGNPAGAKLTARARQDKQISRVEAERLVSFTNSSNPLFIFAAVAVGFFHNASLGILLASAHYLGNIAVGLTMRSYGRKEEAAYTGKKDDRSPFSEGSISGPPQGAAFGKAAARKNFGRRRHLFCTNLADGGRFYYIVFGFQPVIINRTSHGCAFCIYKRVAFAFSSSGKSGHPSYQRNV